MLLVLKTIGKSQTIRDLIMKKQQKIYIYIHFYIKYVNIIKYLSIFNVFYNLFIWKLVEITKKKHFIDFSYLKKEDKTVYKIIFFYLTNKRNKERKQRFLN